MTGVEYYKQHYRLCYDEADKLTETVGKFVNDENFLEMRVRRKNGVFELTVEGYKGLIKGQKVLWGTLI